MHRLEWAQLLVDNAACHKVMTEIWGSKDYLCKGGGGDFVLPGCPNIQPLHEDMVSIRCFFICTRFTYAARGQTLLTTFLAGLRRSHRWRCQGNALRDPSGRMTHRDLPPMACTLNYLMTDVNWENGP